MTFFKRSFRTLTMAMIVIALLSTIPVVAFFATADRYERAVYAPGRPLRDYRADLKREPVEVLRFLGVSKGDRIIDLLGGHGYYAELLSRLVGDSGTVYLQNNSLFLRFSGERLERRLQQGRLPNVVRLDSEFADLMLPKDVDIIFMGLSYHDIYVPREDPVIMTSREEFFPQIKASLKPGGKVLIIDHAAAPGSGTSTTSETHRIDQAYAVADFEREGFVLVNTLDELRNPDDDYALDIWEDAVSGRTDRFVLLFEYQPP